VIPPLRERQREILPLAETLLARHLPKGHPVPAISVELRQFLTEYHWPGNVRELENVMRRFIVYQDSAMLIQELRSADHRSSLSLAKVANFPDASPTTPLDSMEVERKLSTSTRGKFPDRVGAVDGGDRLDRLAEASRIAETEVLLEALDACRWNRRQAAASLQIDYKAFLYKLQKYGIVESKVKRREISA